MDSCLVLVPITLSDNALDVPNLEHVGLIRWLAVLAQTVVNTKGNNLLGVCQLVEGLVKIQACVVLGIARLDAEVLCLRSEQVVNLTRVFQSLNAEVKELHIYLNHALHLDVHDGLGWPLHRLSSG